MIRATPTRDHFRTNDISWKLRGEWKDILFDRHGICLSKWIREGKAKLFKTGPGRAIYRLKIGSLDFHIKHFRPIRISSLLKQFFYTDRARHEFNVANILSDIGVATAVPVALGERFRNGLQLESWLLTETIPDGITLFEWVEQNRLLNNLDTIDIRKHFCEELARLSAKLHETGIEHLDLHEKNIVLQPCGSDRFRFFLLDLHESRIHRKLPWNLAKKELTRLGRYFSIRSSRVDRYRFFRQYCELRGIPEDQRKKLAMEVEHETIESRAGFWRRRDLRPVHKIPRIRIYEQNNTVAYANSELPEEEVRKLMENPNLPFDCHVRKWWKIGRGTRVAEIDATGICPGRPVIYKQYYFKGWHEAACALVRDNQANRAWKCGRSLLLREIPTPAPLVLIEQYRYGMPVSSYLITECVDQAESIPHYLDRILPEHSENERKRIVRSIANISAKLLKKLHDHRVTHRDLKSSNILLTEQDDPALPHLKLIDLDGVQTWQTVPLKQRIQNLSRFSVSFYSNRWISNTDRLRFMKSYLGQKFADRSTWKHFWRIIQRHADKKITRNMKRGRSIV